MRDPIILLVHLIATLARLRCPGGLRSVVAETVLVKRCFRNQLLLLRPYLVLTKPLSHDIRRQRCASVKIVCKYLDN